MHMALPQDQAMSRPNTLVQQRAYIDAVCDALDLDYTGLARRIGVSPTTITRPMNDGNWTFKLSRRTLKQIERLSNIPLPDGALPPQAITTGITMLARHNAAGSLVIEVPQDAGFSQEEAIKLLQLYGAAPPATRRAALLQLQHPGLSAGASSFTDDQLETALEEALAMLDLDRLHRAELLRALLTAVRRLRRGESGPTAKDQAKAKRPRSLQSA